MMGKFFVFSQSMTCPTNKPALHGPASSLMSCINHLGELLKNLPQNLPLNPLQSCYSFGLDTEKISKEGVWFAFNQNLEANFKTHKLPPRGTIIFWERGLCHEQLILAFKNAVKGLTTDADRDFLHEVWLERLITAAELQGAKILAKLVPSWCSAVCEILTNHFRC